MKSCCLEEAPTDDTGTEPEKGFVHGRQAFITHAQPSELMQPCDSALYHPAGFTQPTTVRGATPGNLGTDALARQQSAQRIGVIGAVGLDQRRLASWCAAHARHGRDRRDQRQQLRDVMAVGARQDQRKGYALGVREEVVFAARTTAIGWVRSTFFPAPTARMEELSATAREKSSRFAPRSFDSNTRCSFVQTPRRCQYLSRRQQVIPEPQPISCGSIFQGMPERNTNSIPVSTCRSLNIRRPAYRFRLRLFGSSGSMWAHNSSSINGFGINTSPKQAMPYRTKSVVNVQASFCYAL